MPPESPAALQARLARVKLLLCDVDGVLTDATVLVGLETELKQFNIQDGLGLVLLRKAGIKVGWVSSRISPATTRRAKELEIDFLEQQPGSKLGTSERLLGQLGVSWDEVCYAGDDLVDLAPLKRAGTAVAVANGVAETKAVAHYVTRARGGHGAVREIAELILKAQGKWDALVAQYDV